MATATRTARKTKKTNTDLRLAQVPPMSVYEKYVPRKVNGVKDFAILDYARAVSANVLVEGPTGPGKTMFARAYAAKNKMPFYATPSNSGIEPSQLFGKYIPAAGGEGFVWQDGPVTDVVRNGGLLLINEVNFIPERIATGLFSLLDGNRQIVLLDHKGEVIHAHADLLIMADMNPGYAGTRPLNSAFRNRFSVQLDWDYDPAIEKKLVSNEALLNMAGSIRDQAQAGVIRTPVSTNMLIEFEKVAFALGYEFAAANFVTHFSGDERDAIRTVLQTLQANIEEGIKEYTEDREVNNNWTDGDYTEEDGAYGIHWFMEEEDED